ncbi:MAG: hypothetical protein RL685_965 [Pseudomonadota bacterium]|jgi:hypothetical protein
MKTATQRALAGGLLLAGIAYACATPVEIEGCQSTAPGAQNCDVILAPASEFGGPDASVPAQGGSAGTSSNPPSGGAGSGNNPPPEGGAGSGSAGSGSAGSGSGSGGQGGAAGSGSAGSGSAGTGSAGTGSAGTGSAGTGSGGTGSSNFNLGSCDLQNRNGCEEFACDTVCSDNDGNYCLNNCTAILTCVSADESCITEADPMCGTAFQNPFMNNQCTSQVGGSGNSTQVGTPANVALALIRCLCSNPRP